MRVGAFRSALDRSFLRSLWDCNDPSRRDRSGIVHHLSVNLRGTATCHRERRWWPDLIEFISVPVFKKAVDTPEMCCAVPMGGDMP